VAAHCCKRIVKYNVHEKIKKKNIFREKSVETYWNEVIHICVFYLSQLHPVRIRAVVYLNVNLLAATVCCLLIVSSSWFFFDVSSVKYGFAELLFLLVNG